MNFNALNYFLEIAEKGSLNKAAQSLYISQPALRASISALEKELGAPLIQRTKYGSTLTDFGKKVAAEAPIILNYINSWKEYASFQEPITEEICIYSTKPFCNTILVPVSTLLQQEMPSIKFSIVSGNYLESAQMLKKQKCQLAIIHSDLCEIENIREQLQLSTHYIIEKILETNFLALINKEHPLQQKNSVSLSDLHDLTFTSVSSLEMITNNQILRNGINKNQKRIYCDSHHSIYQIINENSNCFSLLSSIFFMTNAYQIYPNICFKPICDLTEKTGFYLIHLPFNSNSNLQKVCDSIKNYCEHTIK